MAAFERFITHYSFQFTRTIYFSFTYVVFSLGSLRWESQILKENEQKKKIMKKEHSTLDTLGIRYIKGTMSIKSWTKSRMNSLKQKISHNN